METTPKRPIILGVITALPIPALCACFVCVLLKMLNDPENHDSQNLGVGGVVFIIIAGLTVTIHTVMFFYYLSKMQTLKAIKPDQYLAWLPVLMAPGGQIVFWYLFFWNPSAGTKPADKRDQIS